jgi:TRAP-type C4-dicarboxylate transport system permease small subunit
MRLLRRIDRLVTAFIRTAIVILLSSMLVIAILQVLTRYVFNFSFAWSEELLRLAMLWAAFLAASLGVRESKHIGLDLVISRIAEPARSRLRIVMSCIIVILLGVFWVLTAQLTLFMADMVSPITQISKAVWYLSVLAGFTFMVFYYIHNIAEALTGRKKG